MVKTASCLNDYINFENYKKHVVLLKQLVTKKYGDILIQPVKIVKSPYTLSFVINNISFVILPYHTWYKVFINKDFKYTKYGFMCH